MAAVATARRPSVKKKKYSVPQAEIFESSLKGFYAKYNMKDIIGRGVSCVVRRCVDQRTTMQYAAKIIDLTSFQGEEMAETMRTDTLKEAEILQMCVGQPNIIQLRDVFETPAYVFLVFELLVKGELFDYMTEVVTVSEKRTRHIMSQLLGAIGYIHSRRIVHRDIKPENILLDENLNIKLADFGIASFITTDEDLKELMGTPGYLAPEVIKCSMFDNAPGYGRPVDCWAAGVVMYTLLSGIPPFWHRRQMVMLRSIMEGSYNFSNPEWSDIRDTCKDLVSKLLTVDVRDRLTALEALRHAFFHPDEISAAVAQKLDMRYRKFRVAIFALKFIFRLHKLSLQLPEIEVSKLKRDPYGIRLIRRLVDAGAFRIYGHWVQKSEAQNRALLFESEPRKTGSLLKAVYR